MKSFLSTRMIYFANFHYFGFFFFLNVHCKDSNYVFLIFEFLCSPFHPNLQRLLARYFASRVVVVVKFWENFFFIFWIEVRFFISLIVSGRFKQIVLESEVVFCPLKFFISWNFHLFLFFKVDIVEPLFCCSYF